MRVRRPPPAPFAEKPLSRGLGSSSKSLGRTRGAVSLARAPFQGLRVCPHARTTLFQRLQLRSEFLSQEARVLLFSSSLFQDRLGHLGSLEIPRECQDGLFCFRTQSRQDLDGIAPTLRIACVVTVTPAVPTHKHCLIDVCLLQVFFPRGFVVFMGKPSPLGVNPN